MESAYPSNTHMVAVAIPHAEGALSTTSQNHCGHFAKPLWTHTDTRPNYDLLRQKVPPEVVTLNPFWETTQRTCAFQGRAQPGGQAARGMRTPAPPGKSWNPSCSHAVATATFGNTQTGYISQYIEPRNLGNAGKQSTSCVPWLPANGS